VRSKIDKTNASYQAQANTHKKKVRFQLGDLVWIHLGKEISPLKRKNKLITKANGPFVVLEKINDNAYKVDFPRDYRVLATFKVAGSSAYQANDHLQDLRIKYLQ